MEPDPDEITRRSHAAVGSCAGGIRQRRSKTPRASVYERPPPRYRGAVTVNRDPETNRIDLDFGRPITWLALSPKDALLLVNAIQSKLDEMTRLPAARKKLRDLLAQGPMWIENTAYPEYKWYKIQMAKEVRFMLVHTYTSETYSLCEFVRRGFSSHGVTGKMLGRTGVDTIRQICHRQGYQITESSMEEAISVYGLEMVNPHAYEVERARIALDEAEQEAKKWR